MIISPAPAKINLALHITGKRSDGYHLIDSLVVFADLGEYLRVDHGALSLQIRGPEAAGLSAGPDNLVIQAADLMGVTASMRLHKTMPAASGIGGGSADAAASFRALGTLSGAAIPPEAALLGADIPMCLASTPARVQGIGEVLSPLPPLPPVWIVLVNPRVAVSTPEVFRALPHTNCPPLPPPDWRPEFGDLIEYLARTRNDMFAAARALCPSVDQVIDHLSGAPFARMSGSGATCFGLYASAADARGAATDIQTAQPDWWVKSAPLLPAEFQLIRETT